MKLSIKKAITPLIAIAMTFIITGCSFNRTLDDISAVDTKSQVIFVGRIEIDPKITPKDVSVKHTIGGGDLYRTFVMRVGEDVGETTDYIGDTEHSAMVYDDEDYYLAFDRSQGFKTFGGYFYTELGGDETSTVLYQLKGGMEAHYPKSARAVYIGTIKFKRDEFFNLKSINVSQDDYEAAQRRFQKKFKTKMHLVKATLSKAS